MDSYTSDICVDSWSRSSYARALVEISSDNAVPDMMGTEYIKETVEVEYEWKPPKCSLCCVFGHVHESCPKRPPKQPVPNSKLKHKVDKDGFTEVRDRMGAKKKGMPMNNQKQKFEYHPVSSKFQDPAQLSSSTNVAPVDLFQVLRSLDDDKGGENEVEVAEESHEVSSFMMEGKISKSEGASIPGNEVLND